MPDLNTIEQATTYLAQMSPSETFRVQLMPNSGWLCTKILTEDQENSSMAIGLTKLVIDAETGIIYVYPSWPEMMVAEAFTKFKETGINKGGRQIYPHRWRIAIHRTAEDQETITYQLTATSLANPPEATQVHPLIIEKLTHGVEPRDELSRIARSHAEWMSRQNDGIWPEAGTTQY